MTRCPRSRITTESTVWATSAGCGSRSGPRRVGSQTAHQVPQPVDSLRVKAVGPLVQDQHLRIGESAVARPRRWRMPRRSRRSCARRFRRARRAPVRHRSVTWPPGPPSPATRRWVRGPARMVAGRLEHRADLVQRFVQVPVDLPVDRRGARVGPHQAEQHPQRVFAGSVGPRKPVTVPRSTSKLSRSTASTGPNRWSGRALRYRMILPPLPVTVCQRARQPARPSSAGQRSEVIPGVTAGAPARIRPGRVTRKRGAGLSAVG